MIDIVGNLHLHTTASDGVGTHDSVAEAAARAGLDFLIYTDHNLWLEGWEGWYQSPHYDRTVLRLMGQEVNDPNRDPEANHLLCYFIDEELVDHAADPQVLIDRVQAQAGLCFLAHPFERPGLQAAKTIYPWVNWDVSGFTGIELWNAMTDVKWQLRTLTRGVIGAYLRQGVLHAPFPETLAKWDELLASGRKVVAIGNSDAHGMSFSLGPLTRTIYPYDFLFQAVNTHLLLADPLAGQVDQARRQIYQALQAGHCYVCYDLIGPASGFSFTAQSGQASAIMGDSLPWQDSVDFQVNSPQPALLRLIRNGSVVAQSYGSHLTWHSHDPGVYRVEAYRHFWGRPRGWVFTNPIYVCQNN